jgi:hypothetical protein
MDFLIILGFLVICVFIFLLIVGIPIIFGKLFFRWSGRRIHYIFFESIGTIVGALVGTLLLTGLILLIGLVFKQEWAFSGGLLIVYTFWIAIKTVRENIKISKGM